MTSSKFPPPTQPGEFYFLAHPNPNGRHWTVTRRRGKKPTCVVIHTAETRNLLGRGQPAPNGDDTAERVARYGATTKRRVSWHVTTDADSVVWCLPPDFRAWHAGKANDVGLGIEIACRADVWPTAPTSWVANVLETTADAAAIYCRRYGIAPVRIPASVALAGLRTGFVGHGDLDPKRRSDPGVAFPWPDFLARVAAKINQPQVAENVGDTLTTADGTPVLTAHEIRAVRALIASEGTR